MLISVIIPAYNCEKLITRCIDSLIQQTYKDIEIIVVDDGSTDSTYSVIKELAKNDNRIMYTWQSNGGPGAARNKGLKLANGEWFTFVDSDDTVEPTYIQSMIDAAIKNKLDIVISDICVYGKKKKMSGKCSVINGNLNIKSNVIQLIKEGWLNSPVAKLYRLDVQKSYKIFMPTDIDIGEDLQFNLEYVKNVDRLGILFTNLYIYDTCNSTLTKKYRKNEYDIREVNIERLEAYLKINNIMDRQFISYLYIKLMYAECMTMRKYLKKCDRYKRIGQLLNKENVCKSIIEFKPVNVIQQVMLWGLEFGNIKKIDFVAFVLNIGKKLCKNVKRASV